VKCCFAFADTDTKINDIDGIKPASQTLVLYISVQGFIKKQLSLKLCCTQKTKR